MLDRAGRFGPGGRAALARPSRNCPLPHWNKLIWAFLLLGLAARCVRYLVCFPLWEDECFLVCNLIDRSYLQLLEPLDYHQVCPVLFLWAEATAVRLLGFNEYALRLLPLLVSIASLFLFRRVAAQLLRGWALVFAVGWFAVSYPMIRYAAEAKPYGTDLFLGLVQVAMIVEWRQRRAVALVAGADGRRASAAALCVSDGISGGGSQPVRFLQHLARAITAPPLVPLARLWCGDRRDVTAVVSDQHAPAECRGAGLDAAILATRVPSA